MEKGCIWFFGDTENVRVWLDRWVLRKIFFKFFMFLFNGGEVIKVNELIDYDVYCWESEKLREVFL